MGLKTWVARQLAGRVYRETLKWQNNAVEVQHTLLKNLLKKAEKTLFADDHDFAYIKDYKDFRSVIPVRDYEQFSPYFKIIFEGAENVLWPGRPKYFAKTSGTTSGIKHIPISEDSMPYHIEGARNALLNYIYRTGKADFLKGNMIFLSGSPELEDKYGVPTGRLSGIVNHHVPFYLRKNQLPTYTTNCIDDWEEKLDRIVDETINRNMTLISGIPPWVQMYFDRLEARAGSGKKVRDLFSHLGLLVHGGVNFEPYREKLHGSLGIEVDFLETYPASEGFIAYQDSWPESGLLLLLNSGIFYEFVPANEIFNAKPTRLSIAEVETGINYALLMTTNAGLWSYNIGDTVKFVSKNPYRIRVTGRIKHFISAFGEHVIGEEVESALAETTSWFGIKVAEFTVAPQISPRDGLRPYHEWFIEFNGIPEAIEDFRRLLDEKMQQKNIYYRDLVQGGVLQALHITLIRPGGFIDYMKSIGRLGGQNKLPHLSNERKIAESLDKYIFQPQYSSSKFSV